jgi:hypothetical protein
MLVLIKPFTYFTTAAATTTTTTTTTATTTTTVELNSQSSHGIPPFSPCFRKAVWPEDTAT